jgi:hypothetical protein
MPLSAAAPREKIHRRLIEIEGFERTDGLFDIEAWLSDTKTYAFENSERGEMRPGDHLHGMWLRMTVDSEMVIRGCEASMDHTPYALCSGAAPNFAALAGAAIGPGFHRMVKERVGGARGCTHLRELLGQMATVAFQTIRPLMWRREQMARDAAVARGENPPPYRRPVSVNSCYSYAADSPVTRRLTQAVEE